MIAASNGVVIATEKKLPSILVDEASVSIFLKTYALLSTYDECSLFIVVAGATVSS